MSGYIGPSPVPQSIQRRQSFTATAGQTTFGTTGYTDGDFIDVYLNGVKLVGGTDYTATNGTDIVLTTAASASDVLDFVTFNSFQLVDQTFTGQIEFDDGTAAAPSITNTGDVDTGIFFPAADTIGFAEGGSETARFDDSGNLLVGTTEVNLHSTSDTADAGARLGGAGNVLAAGAGTVGYFNRLSTDGTIVDFRKDGTSVGAIGSENGADLTIGNGDTGLRFSASGDSLRPFNMSTVANRDNAVDLGDSSTRFKDLYLSGGVYLGGTGSANKLDDYEEGTWTPTCNVFTITTTQGHYRVIGDMCFAFIRVSGVDNITSGAVRITLPFTSGSNQGEGAAGSVFMNYNNVGPTSCWVNGNTNYVTFYNSTNSNIQYTEFAGGNIYAANKASFAIYAAVQYRI